jgi:NAD+ kinase
VEINFIRIEVTVAGEQAGRFDADGAMVSTPTGSTAYALSLGGPIVHPDVEALIFMPLNPHSLFNRPVLLPQTARVVIRIPTAPAVLVCDGQRSLNLSPGAEVEIGAGPQVQLVQFDRERNFFGLLQQKLRWGSPLIDGD